MDERGLMAHEQVRRFIDRLARFFEEAGGTRVDGQVLAWMMASEGPKSLDGIASGLQISKAAASQSTRMWEKFGFLERIRLPGDRKVYYQVRPDLMRAMLENVIKQYAAFSAVLEEGQEALADAGLPVNPGIKNLAKMCRRLVSRVPEVIRELEDEALQDG